MEKQKSQLSEMKLQSKWILPTQWQCLTWPHSLIQQIAKDECLIGRTFEFDFVKIRPHFKRESEKHWREGFMHHSLPLANPSRKNYLFPQQQLSWWEATTALNSCKIYSISLSYGINGMISIPDSPSQTSFNNKNSTSHYFVVWICPLFPAVPNCNSIPE